MIFQAIGATETKKSRCIPVHLRLPRTIIITGRSPVSLAPWSFVESDYETRLYVHRRVTYRARRPPGPRRRGLMPGTGVRRRNGGTRRRECASFTKRLCAAAKSAGTGTGALAAAPYFLLSEVYIRSLELSFSVPRGPADTGASCSLSLAPGPPPGSSVLAARSSMRAVPRSQPSWLVQHCVRACASSKLVKGPLCRPYYIPPGGVSWIVACSAVDRP